MKSLNRNLSQSALALLVAGMLFLPYLAFGHCDSLDGPVIKDAERALSEGDINHVLHWVLKEDEAEVKKAFEKTLAVRELNEEARELADRYFFETLVRVHRMGEGAPFTGLKPAGRDLGPAIPAADESLKTGNVQPVVQLLNQRTEEGVREHFNKANQKKDFDVADNEAGRDFVKAYVVYIHYVEGIHDAATNVPHGHAPESEDGDQDRDETSEQMHSQAEKPRSAERASHQQ